MNVIVGHLLVSFATCLWALTQCPTFDTPPPRPPSSSSLPRHSSLCFPISLQAILPTFIFSSIILHLHSLFLPCGSRPDQHMVDTFTKSHTHLHRCLCTCSCHAWHLEYNTGIDASSQNAAFFCHLAHTPRKMPANTTFSSPLGTSNENKKTCNVLGSEHPLKINVKKKFSPPIPPPPPIFFAKSELNQHVRFTEKQSQLISALIFPVKLNSAIDWDFPFIPTAQSHWAASGSIQRPLNRSNVAQPRLALRDTAKVSPTFHVKLSLN